MKSDGKSGMIVCKLKRGEKICTTVFPTSKSALPLQTNTDLKRFLHFLNSKRFSLHSFLTEAIKIALLIRAIIYFNMKITAKELVDSHLLEPKTFENYQGNWEYSSVKDIFIL